MELQLLAWATSVDWMGGGCLQGSIPVQREEGCIHGSQFVASTARITLESVMWEQVVWNGRRSQVMCH